MQVTCTFITILFTIITWIISQSVLMIHIVMSYISTLFCIMEGLKKLTNLVVDQKGGGPAKSKIANFIFIFSETLHKASSMPDS